MQDLNIQTPSVETDELAAVSALLSGEEPAQSGDAHVPESADTPETEQVEAEPERADIDYGMKVPISGGDPVTLGELKDAWQSQQTAKLELIERENAIMREREQANLLLSYIEDLPPQVVEAAKSKAVHDYQQQLAILHEAVPESRTPEGSKLMKEAIYRLADEYSVPHQAIDQVKDAVTIKMMYDFARLKDAVKAAKSNVKPLRADQPKAAAAAKPNLSDTQRAIERARQTGSKQDAAAAVEQLIRSA